MFFGFKAATRFINKNKVQNFVIFMTILIGIGVQFFILTLSSTLKNILTDSSFKYSEHVVFGRINRRNSDYNNDLLKDIQNDDDVEMALYKIHLPGTLSIEKNREIQRYPFNLHIADDLNEQTIYQEFFGIGIKETLVSGKINDPSKPEIMLNDAYAKTIGAELGDTLKFHYVNLNKPIAFTLVGTFDNGMFAYNYNFGYISNNVAKIRLNISHIYVKLHDPLYSTEFIEKYEHRLEDESNTITDWQVRDDRLIQMDFAQKAVVGTIETLISVAVFIVVLNMLNYIIQSKYKEIGIFKAMGLKKGSLRSIFIIQILLVTIIASILGLAGGRVAIEIYSRLMVNPKTNEKRFIYQINNINYIALFFLSLLVSFLATLISFRRSEKLSIIELIKL